MTVENENKLSEITFRPLPMRASSMTLFSLVLGLFLNYGDKISTFMDHGMARMSSPMVHHRYQLYANTSMSIETCSDSPANQPN